MKETKNNRKKDFNTHEETKKRKTKRNKETN